MARLTLMGASKDERLSYRQAMIPKGARPILEHTNGSALYVYESGAKFLAIAFWGTSGKPLFHYSYRTEDQRNQRILEFKTSVEHSVELRQKTKTQKAAWANPLNVGDILYTSWGYDQTNTEFFVVTKLSGRRVWVREIAAEYHETGFMSGQTWPAMPIQMIGDETMHTAQPSGAQGVYVKISDCRHAWPEQGRAHGVSSYA